MISRANFESYSLAASRIAKRASKDVAGSITAWYGSETSQGRTPSVAECREEAKRVMAGYVQVYDQAASSLATEWYDALADKCGKHFDVAITNSVWDPSNDDAVARYQARKLANLEGDGIQPFAEACGEYAANDAMRSLNETIICNVGRDRDKGARFARVPTGFETCTFCLMLAGRGAVYHTRETAGAFSHFHRGCDCKVVPSFSGDKDEEVVEGARPQEYRRQWKRFKEIDEDESLTWQQRWEIKMDILSGGGGELYTSRAASEWKNGKLNKHATKHAAALSVSDPKSRKGQMEYDSIMSNIIDGHDAVLFTHSLSGQDGDRCAVFAKGDYLAVVNLDTKTRVTAFVYSPGVSKTYDAIWDQIRK